MVRKLFVILLVAIFISGCNGNDADENNETEDSDNNQTEENNEEDSSQPEDEEEDKVLYQIGETVQGTSSSYGFPYEVTVNDFEVTAEEVAGNTLEDFFSESSSPSEDTRFAVVNVTLKNTGDDSFVPDSRMTPILMGELTHETPRAGVFPEWEEELEPGEEVTSNLVFISAVLFQDGVVYLTYNAADPNKEFQFELPVPEQ